MVLSFFLPTPPPFPLPCLSYFFYIATCSYLAICSYSAICSYLAACCSYFAIICSYVSTFSYLLPLATTTASPTSPTCPLLLLRIRRRSPQLATRRRSPQQISAVPPPTQKSFGNANPYFTANTDSHQKMRSRKKKPEIHAIRAETGQSAKSSAGAQKILQELQIKSKKVHTRTKPHLPQKQI